MGLNQLKLRKRPIEGISHGGKHVEACKAIFNDDEVWAVGSPAEDPAGGQKPSPDAYFDMPDLSEAVTFPVIQLESDGIVEYEARAPGGIVVVSKTNAVERAMVLALRPTTTLVELGKHPGKGDWSLKNRLFDKSTVLWQNGEPIHLAQGTTKLNYLESLVEERGTKRLVMHGQYRWLAELAQHLGIDYREHFELFETLGTKSGLLLKLKEFKEMHKERHPKMSMGGFGNVFHTRGDLEAEIRELRGHGFGAYIKVDKDASGFVFEAGEGNAIVPLDMSEEDLEKTLEMVTQGRDNVTGIVQILVPEHSVFSISSMEDTKNGRHRILEAHRQTQVGASAEGALPLLDNPYSKELHKVWKELADAYVEWGVTGGANMNFIVLPPKVLEVAREIYGDPDLGPVQPIDFNYRPLSGTAIAAYSFKQQTGKDLNAQNFRTTNVMIRPFYAANPAFLYARLREIGLRAGPKGNFAIVKMGNIDPYTPKSQRIQIAISGTERNAAEMAREVTKILGAIPTKEKVHSLAEAYSIDVYRRPKKGEYNEDAEAAHTRHTYENILKVINAPETA